MGAKNKMFKIAQIMAEEKARQMVAEQTTARLTISSDAAIIAAHEALGLGPGRAKEFAEAYQSALDWLATLFVSDADENGDEQIWYAKSKRDDLILSIVGPELFVPFDEAYGDAYIDEGKRIRIKQKTD